MDLCKAKRLWHRIPVWLPRLLRRNLRCVRANTSKRYPIIMDSIVDTTYAPEAIKALLAEYGRKECRADLIWLGGILGKISKRRRFSYRYLHSVLNESYKAGAPLRKALSTFLLVADGVSPFEATATEQTILTPDDLDGCIIQGDRHLCEKERCVIEFVRTNRNRKYCFVCSPRKGES